MRYALAALTMTAVTAFAQPYPEPPQQKAAWTAPKTKLDAKVIDAVKRVFDDGAADPRGCEYREIEVEITDGFEDEAKRIKTRGWVIPKTQFAVTWSGHVYKTVSIGNAANLAADVKAMLEAQRKARAETKRDSPDFEFTMFPSSLEGYYVGIETLAPSKVMMLLRLGEAALAESVWKMWREPQQDLYAILVDDWLWGHFARGIGAHRRGDAALAIESWRRLPSFAKPQAAKPAHFLDDIAALLADAQRRAAKPAPIDLVAVAKLAPKDRIAKLVAALDQVAMHGFLGVDPIIKALVAEGEPAIEPLLVAYESDTRFTRARFVDIKGSDHSRWRQVIPVHEVARNTLGQLVDMSFFQTTATDRRGVAKELRAYIAKWKGVSPLERQYQILADDKLDEHQWLLAANQITAPKANAAGLRKKSPTVTSLFERRLAGYADLRQRARMLEAFAAWDGASAKPFVAKTTRDAFAGWKTAQNRGMDPYLGEALAGLITARIATGDKAALGEYADWLVTTTPEQAQFASLKWFAPLIAHRDSPEAVRASKALFADAKSAWVPVTAKRAGFYQLDLLGSDMIALPAFRAHVQSQLSNKAKLGTIKRTHSAVDIRTDAFQTGEGIDEKDPLLPKEGWTDTLRVNDQYASSLVRGRTGAPTFRRYWPVKERDKAIAAIAAWLAKQP